MKPQVQVACLLATHVGIGCGDLLDHMATTGDASMLVCCCIALALAAMKFVMKINSNKPLMMIPTMAGARIPFVPCLEMPNKAMTPKIKPTTISKRAISSIITRAPTCPPKATRTHTTIGHAQLNLAA